LAHPVVTLKMHRSELT